MRPRLLDLFCCAGGAAMGYHRAGFDVVGIDKEPQPRYPFDFHQADAIEYLAAHGHEFDAIHASPPCPRYSSITPKANRENHPDLVAPTRELLIASGRPYVMENVPGAPMRDYFVLCGTMFGLRTPCGAQLLRHRLFETNFEVGLIPPCEHGGNRTLALTDTGAPVGGGRSKTITVVGRNLDPRRVRTITVTGSTPQRQVERNHIRETFSVKDARVAMGIDWMPMSKLSQAIPPAYTEFIGRALMLEMEAVRP